MTRYDVVVIGGGPAGMTASIFAKRSGGQVILLEKMAKPGKKLLITGAGRCNLLNEKLDPSFYKPEARALVKAVFENFGRERILGFFKELGLYVASDETGRMFPVTNQAASVLKILELEMGRMKIPVKPGFDVRDIKVFPGGFRVGSSQGQIIESSKVILCGGGRSYPALGADGNAYGLAQKLGHSVIDPVPSVVPLLVKDPWCHFLQGQKIRASVAVLCGGKPVKESRGELLFTQYGLSGTAVLDVSDPVSILLHREHQKEVTLEADLLPFMTEKELEAEISGRLKKNFSAEGLFEGLLPHKICHLIAKEINSRGDPGPLHSGRLAKMLKHRRFKAHGTRGWNEAEFTAGGIPASEIHEDLRSKFQKGLYFAGEILDIQAARGGYQLAWAWASGACAGRFSSHAGRGS
ncbi:MAG: tricarballylate dehydrogenase [Candidatus Omnitrophica bacterium ADurb.Bin277]|nr:MAG: tricarballylate dehydrogenase [Candidatus Omnitrophica bacterium ADurb.Bin277]